jgi:hypothetical protein
MLPDVGTPMTDPVDGLRLHDNFPSAQKPPVALHSFIIADWLHAPGLWCWRSQQRYSDAALFRVWFFP